MSKTFEQGREEIAKLCQYFAINRDRFLADEEKEAHIRQSLIDPLFEALGWDVANRAMVAPQYREVIPEDRLDVHGAQKAPDYTFRVGPLPKFYVEAKKCGVKIRTDPGPAYQLRRYGWSAKVAVSILTDFEELAVYDCATRPRESDKASQSRILFFRYEEYPDRWRELWDIFSREAVWSGAFDQYAASKRKRGTSEVDEEFLKEIESWRESLARNMALRNPDLTSDDLNAAVQLTIDRVVFLRMAEDRGLEPYEQLLKLCDRSDIYSRFMRELCRKADEKYNSGLFHFHKEAGVSEAPDQITPKLAIDDKIFKPILQGLYFSHGSPYHFGVMPVEILGTVYERFLGKVIRLTAGHQAKIEEKPEVRKAGGVYYTPAYIVDYIVKQTVGKHMEGRSPAQISGGKGKAPFRVLDMACGSGSFLLGAYQYLLDFCLKWYVEHKPETHKQAVCEDPRDKHWRLTIEEKKRILTTHVFGVDIDPQAVEVTKLSLLLKALEGESDATLALQLRLFHERALPNLANNIKCGNSLIGPDYFTGRLGFDPEEIKRVKAFDWNMNFSEQMKCGGFDCIIGNPPYGALFTEDERAHLETKYDVFPSMSDAYVAFVERAHQLLVKNGHFGFIIPSAWLGGPSYLKLREYILGFKMDSVVMLPFDVFKDAFIDTAILTTINTGATKNHHVDVFEFPKKQRIVSIDRASFSSSVEQDAWKRSADKKIILDIGVLEVLSKLRDRFATTIGSAAEMKRGVLFDPRILTTRKSSKDSHPYFTGDVYRYLTLFKTENWVEFGKQMKECPKEFNWFEGPRILLRRLVNRQQRLMASREDATVITNKNLYVLKPSGKESLEYLLSILNSRLISRLYLSQVSQATKDDFPQVTVKDVLSLPYRAINFNDANDRKRHDRISRLAESMLSLRRQCANQTSSADKEMIERQIVSTDNEIDAMIYELYGLTVEDVAIIEGKSR